MIKLGRRAAASAAAAALALAGYWALRLGYADSLARTAEARAVARAAALAPANARYQARLAAVEDQAGADSGKVLAALEAAVKLNPGYAGAWIELGLRREARGELAAAEKCLQEAARVDLTYEPRWALANFYFRQEQAGRFWEWARRAAQMAYGDARPLYRLCWRMDPSAERILERVAPGRPDKLAQYLGFLLGENHLEGAEKAAARLAAAGGREQSGVVLDYCDRVLEAGQGGPALRVWNRLAERGLIAAESLLPESGRSLTNGDFTRPPLGRGFDWRIQVHGGVTVARGERERALRVGFSGVQPEDCECLWQWVPVMPGRRYRLRFDYRTDEVGAPSGLQWRVREAGRAAELAREAADLAGETWRSGEVGFETGGGNGLVRLVLGYRRASGTARITGALWVRRVRLEVEP